MKKVKKTNSKNKLVPKKDTSISTEVKKFINEKKVFNIKVKKIIAIAVIVLVLFLFVKIIGGIINKFANSQYPEYPLAYQKANGDMLVIGTKDKEGTKLSSSDSIDYVKYANKTNRYMLYEKNGSLYLYDASKKSEKIKVLKDVKEYFFSGDDKEIVILNKKNELYLYDYKKTTKLESEVTSIRGISEDYVLYVRDGSLYLRKLKAKGDKYKLDDKFGSYAQISKNQKYVMFINKEGELKRYNIKKKENTKIASSVAEYYCDDNCDKLYYLTYDDGQTLYYYNGKEGLKIVKDIYDIAGIDVKHKIALYTKNEKNDFTLYFQRGDKAAVKVEDDLKSTVSVEIYKGKELYYINSDKELRYAKIKGNKPTPSKTVTDNVSTSIKAYKKGYVYVANIKGNAGKLYVAKGGRAKEIDEDVYKIFTVNTKGDMIFYLKDYGTSSGDLYYTKGSKPKLIASDVYKYQTIKNNLLYYIKDYSVSERAGDLYRYNGKSKLIEKDVRAMAANPNYFQLD